MTIFRKVKTKALNFPVEVSSLEAFKEKLEKDGVMATQFFGAMINAYINEDIFIMGTPPAHRLNRMFTYKRNERPNDVLGVKFASSNANVIINMKPITFPNPEFEDMEQDYSHLEKAQQEWTERTAIARKIDARTRAKLKRIRAGRIRMAKESLEKHRKDNDIE